jgi:hypothetical protein
LQTLFGEQSFGRLAYGGAVAAVILIATVVSMNILKEPGAVPARGLFAGIQMSAPATPLNPDIYVTAPAPVPAAAQQSYHVASFRPAYVMDSRPVSYELPSSF